MLPTSPVDCSDVVKREDSFKNNPYVNSNKSRLSNLWLENTISGIISSGGDPVNAPLEGDVSGGMV